MAGFGDIDLPAVPADDHPGFPVPKYDANLPMAAGGNQSRLGTAARNRNDDLLPSPIAYDANLPSVAAPGGNLPVPAPLGGHLPAVVPAGVNLPMAAPLGSQLPRHYGDSFDASPLSDPFARSGDLAVAQTQLGPAFDPHGSEGGGGFGELDIPGPAPSDDFGFGDLGGSPGQHGDAWGERRRAKTAQGFGDLDIGPSGDAAGAPPDHLGGKPDGGFGGDIGVEGEGPNRPPLKRSPSLSLDMSGLQGGGDSEAAAGIATDGSPAVVRASVGGMGFGEVDLGGGSEADDDMEFGAIPQERTSIASEEQVAPFRPRTETEPPVAGKRSHLGRWLVVAACAVVLGGAALEFTKHGAFARHDATDRYFADRYAALTRDALKRTTDAFSEDALNRADDAIIELEKNVATAPRYAPLLGLAAYANFAHEIRFGADAAHDTRGKSILARIEADEPSKRLAQAAHDLLSAQIPAARAILRPLAASDPKNLNAILLLGETELRGKSYKDAIAAFEQAAKLEDSARTRAALMRAREASGDEVRARTEALAIAAKYPNHVPSRLLLGRLAWQRDRDEKAAAKWLAEVDKPAARATASIAEGIETGTLRGFLYLERGRISDAREAFNAALAAAKGLPAPGPQLGLGEVNMANAQYPAAIAAFAAASEAAPDMIQAKIGIARAQLKQEKAAEAKATLAPLKDPRWAGEIGYWIGQAEEKLSPTKPSEAIKIYEAAIAAQPTEVKPYIALAMLHARLGDAEDAEAALGKAAKAVPPSDKLHVALGQLKYRQARYPAALAELDAALALQPDNLEALFEKARTLLAMDQASIETAKQVLDQVEAKDPKYPGLAMAMGMYYQRSNQFEEAIRRYNAAEAAAPNDIDVKLQIGRAMVESRDPNAEAKLRDVIDKCSTGSSSPDLCQLDAKHYLGRALLNKGSPADALIFLKQSAEKADTNAPYHLYFGWALVDLDRLEDAELELNRAIEFDKSLGDAYWLRAEILGKKARYKDAIDEAKQALILSPSRHEAHATIAFSQNKLGNEETALAEYGVAIRNDPSNPKAAFWRYEVADIQFHRGVVARATTELHDAIKAANARDQKPPWLPKAHFYLAEAVRGSDKEMAKKEYRAFLDTSVGSTDPARNEAIHALAELGAPYGGR